MLQPMIRPGQALHERIEAAVDAIDLARLRLSQELDPRRRAALGQSFTPASVAGQLAGMFSPIRGEIRIADPGAGIGSLGAAVTVGLLEQDVRPTAITLTAWEIDDVMSPGLKQTMDALTELCDSAGIRFAAEIRQQDFLADGVNQLAAGLFAVPEEFDLVVMNPPTGRFTLPLPSVLCAA